MRFIATLLAMCVIGTMAQSSDADFWTGFDEEEKPFEHEFDNIPDFINKTNVQFYFDLTHHFLTGIERGMYKNSSITLNLDCFGEKFVTKINQFKAMVKSDPMKHIVLEVAIIYQLYFMLSDKCQFDRTINDFYIFCWNKGCRLDEIGNNAQNNFLYMTRSLIDAAIVWYEGVPEAQTEKPEQWANLSRQTGETFSEIIKEFTGFEAQNKFEVRD